jgi:hypothetical protein
VFNLTLPNLRAKLVIKISLRLTVEFKLKSDKNIIKEWEVKGSTDCFMILKKIGTKTF